MNEQANVDELLSSFIDGELTERQRIEVQRLISHDAEAAGRFQRLEKCRMLVTSLPRADAPADMLERVKAGLEARRLTLQETSVFEQRRGAGIGLGRGGIYDCRAGGDTESRRCRGRCNTGRHCRADAILRISGIRAEQLGCGQRLQPCHQR